MLEACNHENIVGFFGSYLQGKSMWIAMEFCGGNVYSAHQLISTIKINTLPVLPKGGSVSDIYGKLGHPLSEMQIAHVTYYSFMGLEYLHEAHMVHRDIKVG